jgi:hypothetical protein
MREIKIYDIMKVWNTSVIIANMKAIIKRDTVTINDLVVMDLSKIRFVNIVKDLLLKDKQVSKENFVIISAMPFGVPTTSKGLKLQIIKMVSVMKGNLLGLHFNLENGVKLFLRGIIISVKGVGMIGVGTLKQTTLNRLHYFQNYDLTLLMEGHFVKSAIN